MLKTGLIVGSGRQLAALANVEIVFNSAGHGYDLDAFLAAASRSDFVFVNTDGFQLGEQAETYWGIRLFELSRKAYVEHFIYSGLDYASRDSGFDPSLGTYLFKLPLGNGAIPFIDLDDLAGYIHWALSNPDQSYGLDLGVATGHASGLDIANAFANITAKPAQYVDLPMEAWQVATWTKLPNGPDTKVGFLSVKDDRALLQTYGENFTAWWNLYKASAWNEGLIQRDYKFLDKILPARVKGVAEWMKKVNYTGERLSTLKILD
ncbi:hypothetical protein EDB80DRAFT_692342 [Ilyonectria destructans]|nr:hypothetical protein EDB80DRAFT_692342 [Ilyonectria destructans]